MQLDDQLARVIGERLRHAGWYELADEEPRFDLRETSEVIFGLSLNLDLSESKVSMYPGLGVRATKVDGLYSRFRGGPAVVGVASIGVSLSYLLSTAGSDGLAPLTRWSARSDADVIEVSERFLHDLEAYGMPYLRSLSTAEAILHALEASTTDVYGVPHLAIAYAAEGRREDAVAALRRYVVLAEDRSPTLAADARAFARALVTHFRMADGEALADLGID